MAAIGKYGKSGRHVAWRGLAAAERHRGVWWHDAVGQAKGTYVFDCPRDPGAQQDADRDQIQRFDQSFAQTRWAIKFPGVVLRPPLVGIGPGILENHRRIIDDGCRRKAVLQRG